MAVESTVRTSTFVNKIRKKHLLRSEVLVSWALFRKSSLLSPVWCKCVVIRDVVKGDKNAKRFGRFVVVAIINNNNNPAQPRVCVCCSMQLKGWFLAAGPEQAAAHLGVQIAAWPGLRGPIELLAGQELHTFSSPIPVRLRWVIPSSREFYSII